MQDTQENIETFETCRATLLSHAYRMLGDMGRAEDIVQEAWLRWSSRTVGVDTPRAYLIKIVTNLCLNELDSAHVRREHSRGDRLPEPITLRDSALARVEALDQISMAFLVLLQRLSPAERAVLLLHDVFDFSHAELGELLGKTEPACRQLLKRARGHISSERNSFSPSHEQHLRALHAFVQAASSGDIDRLMQLLAEDAVLVADAGPEGGMFGRVRNVSAPIRGATKVAAFAAAVTPQGAVGLTVGECELNGQPGFLITRDGKPYSAIALALCAGKIQSIFIHADTTRLTRLR